jgi:uncharacterized protein YodC (DUF2158 family)
MVGECGHIVGTGSKREGFAGANTAPMTTLVRGNNAKVFAEFFVTSEVIEVGSCGPAMQQKQNGRIRGAGKFAKENSAAARKRYFTPWWEVRFWGVEFSHENT